MARIRTIKPQHWSDKELSKISLPAHLLWIALWNFSDDEGIFENDPILIKSQVFPRRTDVRMEQVSQWLDQLSTARFIIPFSHDGIGYYIHRTFKAHQKIDKPQKSKIPFDIIRRIFAERSEIVPDSIVEESKVVVEERKPPPQSNDATVFFDAEEIILNNQIQFERICLAAKKPDVEKVKNSLRKYHLHLEENAKYPMTKRQIYAGFEKWLMNENQFINGAHQQFIAKSTGRVTKSDGANELSARFTQSVANQGYQQTDDRVEVRS